MFNRKTFFSDEQQKMQFDQDIFQAVQDGCNSILQGADHQDENTLLIEAMAGKWTAGKLLDVAAHRGMRLSFLRALGDRANEIRAWSVLDLVAHNTHLDLIEAMLRKTFNFLQRLEVMKVPVLSGEPNPIAEQIIADLEDDIPDITKEARDRFRRRMNKYLGS